MRFYLTFFILFFVLALEAQPLFTLTPDTVFAAKPASTFTMYNYAQFENLSGDTLAMRWVKTQTSIQQGGGHGSGGFGDWTISLQDPTNFYNPAMDVDSADFTLMPITSSTDKFIMQLYPNGQAGALLMTFKIFAINDPANFVEVLFDYKVTPASTAAGEQAPATNLEFSPNPVVDKLNIANSAGLKSDLRLYSPDGKYLRTLHIAPNSNGLLETSDLAPGIYFLRWESEGQPFVYRFSKIGKN